MECVTTIGSSAVVEIAKSMTKPIKRLIGYFFINIEDLQNRNGKLENKIVEAQRVVDDVNARPKEVGPSVSTWLEDSRNLNQQANDLLEENSTRHRSLWSRYRLGKRASKMVENVNKQLNEVPFFDVVLDAPLPKLGTTINFTGMMCFDSRRAVVEEILAALKDDKLSMISICGLGGMGKTTIAKMLVKAVESENHLVSLTSFSQNPDFNRIRSEIASDLGWRFSPDDSEPDRRKILHKKLMECDKKILLIYDDVWKECNNEIGLPSSTEIKNCKIVLTSRFEAVCSDMGSQKNFCIDALKDSEAWDLFTKIAGDTANSSDLHQTAREIVKQCGGLPIAIKTIAGSLNGKSKGIWEDAREHLRNAKWEKIRHMEEKVVNPIKVSYNILQQVEAKSCFLLCCLFPEDFDIPIAYLVRFGMSLKLFEDSDNLKSASNRVEALICELKQSFLLLDGDSREYESVKMHDVVRDIAISIASENRCKYAVLHEATMQKWPATDCTAISLVCKGMKERSVDLEYPTLQLLWLKCYSTDLPDKLFEGMKEIKVLVLDMSGAPPKSLRLLKNLRTLCIDIGVLSRDTSGMGALTNLEFLEIWGSSSAELLKEIARLGNLRVLDLRRLRLDGYLPEGVLSHLTKLEELHIDLGFEENDDQEKIVASLKELQSLPVATLVAWVPKPSIFHEASNFGNISRFKIVVGNRFHGNIAYEFDRYETFGHISENQLCLNEDDISNIRGNVFCALLGKTQRLILRKIQNLKTVVPELGGKCLQRLKTMKIKGCAQLEYIVDVRKEVDDEKIIEDEIVFPNLTDLSLNDLPSLIGLWVEMDDPTTAHHMEKLEEASTSEIQQLNSTSRSVDQVEMIPFTLFPSPSLRFSSLQNLCLVNCERLNVAFPPSVAEQLLQLKTLGIRFCRKMKYIVGREEEEEKPRQRRLFPMLTSIELWDLDELVGFCGDNDNIFLDYWDSLEQIKVVNCPKIKSSSLIEKAIERPSTLNQNSVDESNNGATMRCPTPTALIRRCRRRGIHQKSQPRDNNPAIEVETQQHQMDFLKHKEVFFNIPPLHTRLELKELEIWKCPNLTNLFSPHEAILFVKLERLSVESCKKIKEIIGKEDEESSLDKVVLPQLRFIKLSCLDNLRSFYNGISAMKLPSLQVVEVDVCNQMKTFSYGPLLSTPKLKEVHISRSKYSIMEDLNATVKEVIGTTLQIYNIANQLLGDEDLSKFLTLYIKDCPKLVNAIPCNLMPSLQNLEKLIVNRCESLEEIFEHEGVNNCEGTFSHLQEIQLEWLENLKHIFNKIPREIVGFQDLRKLKVEWCRRLRNIFSVSMASCMLQLQELQVKYCWQLKEIVAKEEKGEEEEAIVFPQLRLIEIEWCDNLECFYSGIYALKLPLLQSLTLGRCDGFKTFSNGLIVMSPNLQTVTINRKRHPLEGDLNATLIGLRTSYRPEEEEEEEEEAEDEIF